jgi:hypothetical protein
LQKRHIQPERYAKLGLEWLEKQFNKIIDKRIAVKYNKIEMLEGK